MVNKRRKKVRTSRSTTVGGRWLPNILIWGGALLMLTGGVIAYPTIQGYLVPPDAENLQFSVTLTPLPAALAGQPTPQPEQAQPTIACPEGDCGQQQDGQDEAIATPTAPPPVILPETELIEATATPTAVKVEEQTAAEATSEPTPTASPTPTLEPTPTPDPASLIPNRLLIPAIDLDAPVTQVGWETQEVNGQLVSSWIVPNDFSAGWHMTSALVGKPGNTVLNGHHNIYGEVFRNLEDLQPGDEIILYAGDTPHYYAVTERHILKEKNEPAEVRQANAQFIMPTEDERLTMVTCWPYTNNTHRLVIVALPTQPTPLPTTMVE